MAPAKSPRRFAKPRPPLPHPCQPAPYRTFSSALRTLVSVHRINYRFRVIFEERMNSGTLAFVGYGTSVPGERLFAFASLHHSSDEFGSNDLVRTSRPSLLSIGKSRGSPAASPFGVSRRFAPYCYDQVAVDRIRSPAFPACRQPLNITTPRRASAPDGSPRSR
jgi:hypothetical protein